MNDNYWQALDPDYPEWSDNLSEEAIKEQDELIKSLEEKGENPF